MTADWDCAEGIIPIHLNQEVCVWLDKIQS